MDLSLERDSSVLGSLFQHIINDMKNTSPLWEDFVAKTGKLHACLRAAIQAIAAYLDAFQKIADAATNSRGASKEIGTALTRVCLRHRAVETRLKTFTAAIMDCLVQPLQEKLEDWKRTVSAIDKEHAKEHKRCRTELKKRSTDTLRLQKKARKGQSDTIQSLVDSHMQDVTLRRAELEEVEKKSLRSIMIEERLRYCTFVHMLQPVVKEECEVMSELGHLQEAMQSIANVTKEPNVLPAASEELIQDAKATMSLYPESPVGGSGSQGACSNSLGSRKSSVCSISSINSSGSSNSPGHHHYPRSLSQLISPAIRLKPGESSDSGFCSSPALTTQASNVTNQSSAVATWPPHSQEAVAIPPNVERPHTISTTYEKGHQRPPLTVYTFQNPETILEGGGAATSSNGGSNTNNTPSGQNTPSTQKSPASTLSRPPLPVRCSSLERPLSANANNANNNRNGVNLRHCPSPIPAHITKELATHHAQQQQQQHQNQNQQQQLSQQQIQQQQPQMPSSPPTYVNMSELANMAALKITNQQQQQQPVLTQQHSIDSISSQHSNESSSTSNPYQTPPSHQGSIMKSARSHSTSSSTNSSHSVSLHSHPSIESTVATPLVGQTPTTSSGSSTPQNHYSPLLTNSPSSTAAGTPSGASIASGVLGGNFVYNVNSPTPPMSANSSTASGAESALKITETEQTNQLTQLQNVVQSSTNTTNTSTAPDFIVNNQNTANHHHSAVDTDSPTIVENDERSRASVLQKASMFEKQAAAVAASTVGSTSNQAQLPGVVLGSRASGDSGIYGTRRSDDQNHYRTGHAQQDSNDQQDMDKSFEDSIQELNNLIGELDSFQREIDASKQQQQQQEPHQQRKPPFTNIDPPFPTSGIDFINELTTTATTPQMTTSSAMIGSSNQTNSSGCGTDISDTTSDEIAAETRSVTSLNFHHHQLGNNNGRSNLKQLANYNSDSELSRCYVSETSSLTSGLLCSGGGGGGVSGGGDGYENPTFAHFSHAGPGDSISQAGSELCQQEERQAFIINAENGDSSSAVVVIYDHQIPITPDIDYAKQNSEIVVLRTKDPQPLMTQSQEMRELQELPANLSGTPPESPPTSPNTVNVDNNKRTSSSSCNLSSSSTPHTATVQPAKQRLSSFRASSEQQLQLLGIGGADNGRYHHHGKGGNNTRIPRRSSTNAAKPPPPVRRSSSVTPSHNSSTGSINQQQPQTPQKTQQQPNATVSNLIQQQKTAMHNSAESLPPPPAYLLETRPTQTPLNVQTTTTTINNDITATSLTQNTTLATNLMPNSALKVAETVKALSAMRHQPASPNALRRLQQQQQSQQSNPALQCPPTPPSIHRNIYETSSMATTAGTSLLLTNDEDEFEYSGGFYNPYIEVNSYALSATSSTTSAHAAALLNSNCQKMQKTPPSPIYQTRKQFDETQTYYNKINHSFRTTSPGIYAQPKIANMSSFRSASPGPNGQHGYQQTQTPSSTGTAPHHLPPTQPKTNPNLIAQLNARINSKQQQHQQQQQQQQKSTDGIYGSSPQHQRSQSAHAEQARQQQTNQQQQQHTNEATIYARNYNQQQQQQQNYDDYVGTNIEKAGSIRSKTKAEFLENLNAKLAKQNISGRAFAVRNLINNKALPDPRACHESLMDQIKRGATLKRNQKINDRSAPKIH